MAELTPNPMPPGQICGTCRFAGTAVLAGEGADRTMIRCKRFPPSRLGRGREEGVTDLAYAHADTGWPVLTWDDWCGGWMERLPTPEQTAKKIEGFNVEYRRNRRVP